MRFIVMAYPTPHTERCMGSWTTRALAEAYVKATRATYPKWRFRIDKEVAA